MNQFIKKSLKQVIAWSLCGILLHCPVFFLCVNAAEQPNGLFALGAVLMDADSGRVLFSKNENEIYAMASTTKIMTCILALEYGNSEQVVTFSERASSMPDVQMNAAPGEKYYLKDLLYSIMLESHNDSAVAIAEAIGGKVEEFSHMMNQKAEAIGCEHTNFVTPNGLDGENEHGMHGTTAKDLALIMRYCTKISPKAEEFIQLTGTPAYEFQEINGKRYVTCQNHNALLTSYEGAFTGKTGFTGKAGYCYVGAVKRENKTMIIALLGSGWYPNRSYKWKDSKELLDYGFENYDEKMIGRKQWEFPDATVIDGMKEQVPLYTDAKQFSYLLGKNENIQCKIEYAKMLHAPVKANTVVGTITYELNGIEIEQYKIYTLKKVEKATMFRKLEKWLKNIAKFWSNLS